MCADDCSSIYYLLSGCATSYIVRLFSHCMSYITDYILNFSTLFHFIHFINPNDFDDHSDQAPLPTGRDSDKLRPGLWQYLQQSRDDTLRLNCFVTECVPRCTIRSTTDDLRIRSPRLFWCRFRSKCHGAHHRLTYHHRHLPNAMDPLALAFHPRAFCHCGSVVMQVPVAFDPGSTCRQPCVDFHVASARMLH